MAQRNREEILESAGWQDTRSCDEIIVKAAQKYQDRKKDSSKPVYDIFQIDSNMSALNELLQNTLGLRQAHNTLIDKATRQQMDFDLFKTNAAELEKLEAFSLNDEQLTTLMLQLDKAVTAFSANDDPLGIAMAEYHKVEKATLEFNKDMSQTKKRLISIKWQALKKHKAELEQFSKERGHALNYIDQADRIKWSVEENVIEISERMISMKEGLETIFNFEMPNLFEFSENSSSNELTYEMEFRLPADNATRSENYGSKPFLDYAMFWAREATRFLNLTAMETDTFEVTFQLRPDTNTKKLKLIVDGSGKFDEKQNYVEDLQADGRLNIDLTKAFDARRYGERVRIKAVGLSITHNNITDKHHHWARGYAYSAKLLAPPQEVSYQKNKKKRKEYRRPILLNNVKDALSHPFPTLVSNSAIENIDPRGVWSVLVDKYVGYVVPLDKGDHQAWKNINAINLHFLIQSTLPIDKLH